MKIKMMKSLFTLLCLLCSMSISAYDFEVDGIFYNILTDENGACEVTYGGEEDEPSYSGNVSIPATVTYNGTSYTVKRIGELAFSNCEDLTGINLPNTITYIGEMSFYYCVGLTDIALPSSLESFGIGSFAYCHGLTSVTIPKSVTKMERAVFTQCSNLTQILVDRENPAFTSFGGVLYNKTMSAILEVPDGMEGDFEIPASVTRIGEGAFYGKSELTSIYIPNTVTTLDAWAFQGCHSLTELHLPNTITSIGEQAFADCSSLKSLVLPEKVTQIEDWMFMRCYSLESVTIPAKVQTINKIIFRDCPSLQTVYCLATVPPVTENLGLEDDQYQTVTLYVPNGSAQAYRAAANWSKFANIVEFDPTGIGSITADGNAAPATYYDLQGRRLDAPRPGLNIVNGKKVLIK